MIVTNILNDLAINIALFHIHKRESKLIISLKTYLKILSNKVPTILLNLISKMAAINVILKIPIDRICNNRSKNIYNKNFTFSDDSNTDDVVQNYEKCIIYFIFYYCSEWIILSILSVHESTLLLTFLSIVRGMQIFGAKSRLQ